jgi:apolipoprotein D and lipocalin family protein
MITPLRTRWALALLLAVVPLAPAAAPAQAPTDPGNHAVTAVPAVDLDRYAGLWFEIARIPNRFQKQCARESLALYSRRADGRLKVVNQCRRKNGQVDQARGVARVIDTRSRAKLKVSLVSFLGLRPFWGDYWIIGLDENYRWAVVGSPDRRYGWILARTPTLERSTLDMIFSIIERNGFRREAFASDAP